MDPYKKVTITISFSPLRALYSLVGVFVCFALLGSPNKLAPATAEAIEPPPPTPAQIAMNKEIAMVESEMVGRIRGATANETHKISVTIVKEARAAGFDPLWILAIIETESNYDMDACSPAKARGPMQLVRTTFDSVSDDPRMFDPVVNIKAGIKYLAKLGRTFKRPQSILMAYNGGPRNATNYLKAFYAGNDLSGFSDEMRSYPGKVMGKYAKLLARNGKNPKLAHKLYRV